MNIIATIECFAVVLAALYLIGFAVVWIYDFKRNFVYRRMQEQAKNLENLRLSMAVMHAKKYKIIHDYRKEISTIERVQQNILKNLLLIRKAH